MQVFITQVHSNGTKEQVKLQQGQPKVYLRIILVGSGRAGERGSAQQVPPVLSPCIYFLIYQFACLFACLQYLCFLFFVSMQASSLLLQSWDQLQLSLSVAYSREST